MTNKQTNKLLISLFIAISILGLILLVACKNKYAYNTVSKTTEPKLKVTQINNQYLATISGGEYVVIGDFTLVLISYNIYDENDNDLGIVEVSLTDKSILDKNNTWYPVAYDYFKTKPSYFTQNDIITVINK